MDDVKPQINWYGTQHTQRLARNLSKHVSGRFRATLSALSKHVNIRLQFLPTAIWGCFVLTNCCKWNKYAVDTELVKKKQIEKHKQNQLANTNQGKVFTPWKLSNFQDPSPPLSSYFKRYSTQPLTLDVQFQTNSPLSLSLLLSLSKNITKCFLKKSFFSAHFAMNLFYLHNLKT